MDTSHRHALSTDADTSESPTRWRVETDIEINNLSAGVIFAGDSYTIYLMWANQHRIRLSPPPPHIWRGSTVNDATCAAEINLTGLADVQVGTPSICV